MGNTQTFILTLLSPAWKSGDQEYPESSSQWIVECSMDRIWKDLDWDYKEVEKILKEKQPQLKDLKVLHVEQTSIFIA